MCECVLVEPPPPGVITVETYQLERSRSHRGRRLYQLGLAGKLRRLPRDTRDGATRLYVHSVDKSRPEVHQRESRSVDATGQRRMRSWASA